MTTTTPNSIIITTTIEVSHKQIRGLLCSALEGGANYWYEIAGNTFRGGIVYQDFQRGGRLADPDGDGEYWHPQQIIPLTPGCSTIFRINGNEDAEVNGQTEWALNLDSIANGLKIMAAKYPQHFQDFMSENEDAETGDVFLQCCLFGEIVFG